jgi:uncharacterized damage-inducible protein DinB
VKQHYVRFARYNQWANIRFFNAADSLSEDKLWQDKGAFFGSLMGTLNHILVADGLWMARFSREAVPPLTLNSVLHRDLPGLRRAREKMDLRILDFVGSLDETQLASTLDYANTQGERQSLPLELLLAHLFNHQAHHRGQAHGLLSQLGAEPPALDLMYFIRQG